MIDLTRRTAVLTEARNDPRTYIEYDVQEGETPEMLADRMYDSPDLYWVIMMFNELHDINQSWPLTTVALERYITRAYDDPNGIHHYESASTGARVTSNHPLYDRVPVTNYEFEMRANEAKRRIKLPIPDLIGSIVSQHNSLVQL